MKVALIGPERRDCGIGDYTRALAPELAALVELVQLPVERVAYEPPVLDVDVAHLQYEHAFFLAQDDPAGNLDRFLSRLGPPVLVTLHCLPLEDARWQRWLGAPGVAFHVMNRTHERALRRMDPSVRVTCTPAPHRPLATPHETPAALRERLGIGDRPVLAVFGFVMPHKGHDVALEALLHLPDEVVLVVAGGAQDADGETVVGSLWATARRLGLADRLVVTGYLEPPDVTTVLAAADVLLLPYRTATSSAALATSLAAGRAVVASDLPQFRELEGEFGAPRCFRTGDAAALAAVVSAVMSDAAEKQRLAAAAARAAEVQGFDGVARACVDAYRALLAGAGEGS